MRLKFILGLCLAAALTAAKSNAEEALYQIEVMLIAYTDEMQLLEEDWVTTFDERFLNDDYEQYFELEGEQESDHEIEIEADEIALDETTEDEALEDEDAEAEEEPEPLQLSLTDAVKHINFRRDMKLLWHETWVEALQGSDISEPRTIEITEETDLFSLQLTGELSFSLSRYLHITTDLTMQHSADGEPIRAAKIQQSRRMRSSELHYLDHPMLGIMVKIVPYEAPQTQADTED